MSRLTVCIPVYGQPNFLAQALRGLVRNSLTRPRILVGYSDPARDGNEDGRDYKRFGSHARYTSVADYLADCGQWCALNNIEFYDLTGKCLALRGKGNPDESHGIDVAIKNNLLTPMVDSEFFIPNWDADFYPSPGWDESILGLADYHQWTKRIVLPSHVVPHTLPAGEDFPSGKEWHRAIACNVLGFPTYRADWHIREADWDAWASANREKSAQIEPAGTRYCCHFLPAMYKTDEYQRDLKEFALIGSGYEVEMNNRAGECGFASVTSEDAFILHKGIITD